MGRRPKDFKALPVPDPKTVPEGDQYLMAADLEKQLDTFGKDVVNMMTYGTMPELLDLSWEVYNKFKRGELQNFAGSEEDLKNFFDYKKKDLIIKLLGFMDLASNSLLDTKKLNNTSLRDIAYSIKITLDMLTALQGTTPAKEVKHTHTHKVQRVSEVDARIKKTREELEAIEAEYEDVEPSDTDL